jgi:hypothetical protein
MRNWLCFVVVVGVGGVLGAACSSTPAEKYPSIDSFCAAKATEECQIYASCAVDVNACNAKRKGLCNADGTAATNAGRHYTSGRVQDCIDKVHTLYQKSPITPSALADANDTCARVYQGTAPNNSPCSSDYDCAGSSICDKGLCGTKVLKNLGDGCANAGEVCGGDSYCGKPQPTSPNVCLAKKTSGQPCDGNNPCSTATPLRCDNTCQPAFGASHVCADNNDCAPTAPFCDVYNGNICDAGIIFAPSAKTLCAQYGGSG